MARNQTALKGVVGDPTKARWWDLDGAASDASAATGAPTPAGEAEAAPTAGALGPGDLASQPSDPVETPSWAPEPEGTTPT